MLPSFNWRAVLCHTLYASAGRDDMGGGCGGGMPCLFSETYIYVCEGGRRKPQEVVTPAPSLVPTADICALFLYGLLPSPYYTFSLITRVLLMGHMPPSLHLHFTLHFILLLFLRLLFVATFPLLCWAALTIL